MKQTHKYNKVKGFTLIELIIVISIIAILATAFVPKMAGFITEAKKVTILNEATKIIATYESLKIRTNNAIDENTSISTLIAKSNGLLEASDITKINPSLSIEDCINVLDTENYTFNLDNDNKLSKKSDIKLYSSITTPE